MKIICKTTLLAAESPGTFITIDVTDASPTFGFKTVTQADGCDPAAIDWGDGIQTGLDTLAHTYAAPGRYTIAISDAIREFGISHPNTSSVYYKTYAPMVVSVRSTAQKLTDLTMGAFINCFNMTEFDMKIVPLLTAPTNMLCQCAALTNLNGLPTAIETIQTRTFAKCTGLVGSVPLLNLKSFSGSAASNTPFSGCLGVTELHLSEANRESITTCPAFADAPTLGAVNATLVWEK